MELLLLYMDHLLNNGNIVTGPKDVSLCGQQSYTFSTDRCTNLDLHFVGFDPDLDIISLVRDYCCWSLLYSPKGLLLEYGLPPRQRNGNIFQVKVPSPVLQS